ncbi:MAG: phosphatase PAP2 family protein [Acidimicrobiia bacterium]
MTDVSLAPEQSPSPPEPPESPPPLLVSLHDHPPATPAGLLLRSHYTVPVVVGAFVLLALAAAVNGGSLLLTWDEPVQRWVEAHRSGALDALFRFFTRFGGLTTVLSGLAVLLALVYRLCRPLALALLIACAARPLIEWTLKSLVDRSRPDLDRMVPGNGPSFPSGHVMAAIAVWGLVPPVVALCTNRRVWWWIASVSSGILILLVGASRIYLGVHWFSDVVGALLFGVLYLLAIELVFDRAHHRYGCAMRGASHDAR